MDTRIKVIEKPVYISFDDIHELLWKANENNRKRGFILATSEMDGTQLAARVGKNGKCFVALDGEQLVGTVSVRYIERDTWYATGLIPDYILAAVHPSYQGKHVNSMLSKVVFEYVRKKGDTLIELDTAENNIHAIEIYKHLGFELVGYKVIKGADHNSVIMVKWLSNSNKPLQEICAWKFKKQRFLIRLRYKVGGKKRFGI